MLATASSRLLIEVANSRTTAVGDRVQLTDSAAVSDAGMAAAPLTVGD